MFVLVRGSYLICFLAIIINTDSGTKEFLEMTEAEPK